MAKYIDLNDPKTGEKLNPTTLARDYVLGNNTANDDLVQTISKKIPNGTAQLTALNQLYSIYNEFQKQGKSAEASATLDVMAFYYVRGGVVNAQSKGEPRIQLRSVDDYRLAALDASRDISKVNALDKAKRAREDALTNVKQKEQERLESRNPLEEATERTLGAHSGENYQAILGAVTSANKGVTLEAARTRLLNHIEDNPGLGLYGDAWKFKTALKVHDLAQQIAKERGNDDLFLSEKKLKADAASKAAAKAKEGKHDVAGKSVDQILAMAVKEFSSGKTTEEINVAAAIVKQYGSAITDPSQFAQLFINLNAASQQEGAKAGISLALTELTRARDIFQCQKDGCKTIDALNSNAAMQADAYWNRVGAAWFKASTEKGFKPQADFALPTAEAVAAAGAGAAGGANIPPVPAGPDNVAYGPYLGQTYAASNTPRGKVREAQLLLEALGPEYSTGPGNTARFAAGQHDASAMDGIVGEMTDGAIKKFQAANGIDPANGELTEATIAKLHAVADAKLAAARAAAAATSTTDAPAPTTDTASTPLPGSDVAARAMAAVTRNDVGADTNNPSVQADIYPSSITPAVAKGIFESLFGITMTPEQAGRMTSEGGRIHSDDILRLEKAFNAVRGNAKALEENGNLDGRLQDLAQIEGIKPFIQAVFSGAASVADNQAPGSTGAGGNGQGTSR